LLLYHNSKKKAIAILKKVNDKTEKVFGHI